MANICHHSLIREVITHNYYREILQKCNTYSKIEQRGAIGQIVFNIKEKDHKYNKTQFKNKEYRRRY